MNIPNTIVCYSNLRSILVDKLFLRFFFLYIIRGHSLINKNKQLFFLIPIQLTKLLNNS